MKKTFLDHPQVAFYVFLSVVIAVCAVIFSAGITQDLISGAAGRYISLVWYLMILVWLIIRIDKYTKEW